MLENRKKSLLIQRIIQEQQESGENYLTRNAVKILARHFDISEEEVLDTATFYKEISFQPRGKYVIRLCNSPCCYFSQERRIAECLSTLLSVGMGETTKDRMFTLEETGCIGACDEAPAMMVNEEIYGNLTPQKVRNIIDKLKGVNDK